MCIVNRNLAVSLSLSLHYAATGEQGVCAILSSTTWFAETILVRWQLHWCQETLPFCMWHILVQWQLQGFSTDAKKQSSFAWDTRIQDRSSYLFSMCNIAVGVIRVCNMHFLIIRVICRNHPGAMTAAKSSSLMPKINHLFCPTHSDVQCCLVCCQQCDLQKPSYYRSTPLLHVTHATEAWFAETIMVQLQLQRILHRY